MNDYEIAYAMAAKVDLGADRDGEKSRRRMRLERKRRQGDRK